MVNLTYRDLGADDFEAMHCLATQWQVVRQLGGWPWPASPEFTKSRCKTYGGKGFVWGICLDGSLVGSVAVTGRELGCILLLRGVGSWGRRHLTRCHMRWP